MINVQFLLVANISMFLYFRKSKMRMSRYLKYFIHKVTVLFHNSSIIYIWLCARLFLQLHEDVISIILSFTISKNAIYILISFASLILNFILLVCLQIYFRIIKKERIWSIYPWLKSVHEQQNNQQSNSTYITVLYLTVIVIWKCIHVWFLYCLPFLFWCLVSSTV